MLCLLNDAVKYLEAKYGKRATPYPLMTTGYSEGGAYSIFFSACVSNAQSTDGTFAACSKDITLDLAYKFVSAAGMDGAYDAIDVTKDFLFK
jgi:hypothetical protein